MEFKLEEGYCHRFDKDSVLLLVWCVSKTAMLVCIFVSLVHLSVLKSHPQKTTVTSTSGHEKKFALLVEELFSDITCPEYRQLVVEASVAAIGMLSFSLVRIISCPQLLMVVSTLLERNPELRHDDCLNLDEVCVCVCVCVCVLILCYSSTK